MRTGGSHPQIFLSRGEPGPLSNTMCPCQMASHLSNALAGCTSVTVTDDILTDAHTAMPLCSTDREISSVKHMRIEDKLLFKRFKRRSWHYRHSQPVTVCAISRPLFTDCQGVPHRGSGKSTIVFNVCSLLIVVNV